MKFCYIIVEERTVVGCYENSVLFCTLDYKIAKEWIKEKAEDLKDCKCDYLGSTERQISVANKGVQYCFRIETIKLRDK